jgi:hypothetical protein
LCRQDEGRGEGGGSGCFKELPTIELLIHSGGIVEASRLLRQPICSVCLEPTSRVCRQRSECVCRCPG